jgi:hypothetical protein
MRSLETIARPPVRDPAAMADIWGSVPDQVTGGADHEPEARRPQGASPQGETWGAGARRWLGPVLAGSAAALGLRLSTTPAGPGRRSAGIRRSAGSST